MSSAKVSRLVGDLGELGSENGTQFTWNTWIIIIFPNCHNCGYSPISDCQVGDTMSFPLCLVKNHNFYWDVLAVLVFVCIPASTIFRQLEVSLSLCTVQRLSLCGEVVARHWLRLIFCPARNMGPTCCQGDNETVRIGLETYRKTSKSNGKFSFSLFWWPFHHWRKTHEVPLWHTIDLRSQDTLEVGTYLRGAYPHAKLIIMGWQPGWFGGSAVACCPGALFVWLVGTAETRSHGGNVALCALAGQHLFDAGFACSLRWNDVKWSTEFLQWVCSLSDFGHLRFSHQQNLQSSQSSKFWSQAFWFRRHPTSLLQFPPWSRSGFLMPTWTPSVPRWNSGSYFWGWHQAMDAPFFTSLPWTSVDHGGPWRAPSGWGIYQNISQEVNRQVITRADPLMDERLKVAKDREWTELSGEKGQLVMLMM